MLNLWQAIITYINNVYTNQYNFNNHMFTRRELIENLRGKGFHVKTFGYGSMDQYRNILTKAGYIKKLGNGVYEVFKLIPFNITITEVRKQADGVYNPNYDPFIYPAPILKELKPKGFLSKKDFEI